MAIIYHFFPHYRIPVLRELAKSDHYRFEFWGAYHGVDGIPCFTGDEAVTVHEIGLLRRGSRTRLSGFWAPLIDREVRAIIVLGDANIAATWLIAAVGRGLGKRVLFWAHGWLRKESPVRAAVRRLYFSLGHRVLVYSDRAQELASAAGFSRERVVPIFNSLDWEASSAIYHELDKASAGLSGRPDAPIKLVCTARLTSECRFEILLRAMLELRNGGVAVRLTLVGDGPEREALETYAKEHDLQVQFTGAIYDEVTVAKIIYEADFTVSPGKVGLTAIHSLTYGTPVITHGDFDRQMPEVEVIEPGVTGAFFRAGDPFDLARTIAAEANRRTNRAAIRCRCREVVAARWTPRVQRERIELALDQVMRGSHD